MIKLFQILPHDAEYFGLLLIKSSDSQSYSNCYKRNMFMLLHSESILYSSSQIENVPEVVEDGDSPLQSTL